MACAGEATTTGNASTDQATHAAGATETPSTSSSTDAVPSASPPEATASIPTSNPTSPTSHGSTSPSSSALPTSAPPTAALPTTSAPDEQASETPTADDGAATDSASGQSAPPNSSGANSEPDLTNLDGETLAPSVFAAGLDGFLYRGSCNGGSASFECPLSGCSNGEFRLSKSFTLGGSPDSNYEVALHVYGVTELRSDYEGGTRRQASASNAQSEHDFWYEGGSYTPGAGYNVYGLRVTPAVTSVADAVDGGNNYFLNARDNSAEGHEVWELNYTAKLVARGGSTVEFTAYDPNCLQIMNNRETAKPSAGSGTNGAIVVSGLDQAEPPPDDFEQPLSTNNRNGQWVFIDVTGVTVRE